jgi:hypothetical protein
MHAYIRKCTHTYILKCIHPKTHTHTNGYTQNVFQHKYIRIYTHAQNHTNDIPACMYIKTHSEIISVGASKSIPALFNTFSTS